MSSVDHHTLRSSGTYHGFDRLAFSDVKRVTKLDRDGTVMVPITGVDVQISENNLEDVLNYASYSLNKSKRWETVMEALKKKSTSSYQQRSRLGDVETVYRVPVVGFVKFKSGQSKEDKLMAGSYGKTVRESQFQAATQTFKEEKGNMKKKNKGADKVVEYCVVQTKSAKDRSRYPDGPDFWVDVRRGDPWFFSQHFVNKSQKNRSYAQQTKEEELDVDACPCCFWDEMEWRDRDYEMMEEMREEHARYQRFKALRKEKLESMGVPYDDYDSYWFFDYSGSEQYFTEKELEEKEREKENQRTVPMSNFFVREIDLPAAASASAAAEKASVPTVATAPSVAAAAVVSHTLPSFFSLATSAFTVRPPSPPSSSSSSSTSSESESESMRKHGGGTKSATAAASFIKQKHRNFGRKRFKTKKEEVEMWEPEYVVVNAA